MVVSAFAYDVEFYNQDGSETYYVGSCDDYIYFYELSSGYGVGVELEYDGGLPSFEVETEDECLGWSLTPNSDTAEFGLNSSFSSDMVDVEPVMFYLVTVGDGGGSVTPDPDPTGRIFVPLAEPVGWDYYGTYSPYAYFGSEMVGATHGNSRDWPASYPGDDFQVYYPSSGYDTFQSGVTLKFRENLRDVWYTVLVRAAWYPSSDLPSDFDIVRNAPDIIVTAPYNTSGSTMMFDINALESTVRMSTSVDQENNVVYFDYDVSFYLPSSVATASSVVGPYIQMTHSAELQNIGYAFGNGNYRLISVYANIADSDTTADRVYQEYSTMSTAKLVSAEGVKQELGQLKKPDPIQIVPDIDAILPPDDTARVEYVDTLEVVFESSLVVNMMLICFSVAFVSYVLFGKRG